MAWRAAQLYKEIDILRYTQTTITKPYLLPLRWIQSWLAPCPNFSGVAQTHSRFSFNIIIFGFNSWVYLSENFFFPYGVEVIAFYNYLLFTISLREHCSLLNLTEDKTALKKINCVQICMRQSWGFILQSEGLMKCVREVSFIRGPKGIIREAPLVLQAICYGI